MDLTQTLPTPVYVIWWTTLLAITVVVVPLAILLLHRTLKAAISIRRYLAEMLEAGVGIAGNTRSVAALDDTIAVAGGMVKTAASIKEHSATIATVLSSRATRAGAP